MIMDIKRLGAICDNPVIRGKHLTEFTKKLEILTKEEIKASFEVSCKDMLTILSETVPCVGCRKRCVMVFFIRSVPCDSLVLYKIFRIGMAALNNTEIFYLVSRDYCMI